jgi:hypothetical protein
LNAHLRDNVSALRAYDWLLFWYKDATSCLVMTKGINQKREAERNADFQHYLDELVDALVRPEVERKPEESDTGKDAVSILILKTLVNCCPKCKGVGSIGYYDDENQYQWRPCENCKEARLWLDAHAK